MDCCHVGACKLFPCVFNPLHLHLLLCITQIIWYHAERTIAEQQIDLLQRQLLRFLRNVSTYSAMPRYRGGLYLEHEPYRW